MPQVNLAGAYGRGSGGIKRVFASRKVGVVRPAS